MLTKYILTVRNEPYELQPDDLKNWAEIQCTLKRSDFGGIVRSFTSKFEFVNKAYNLLMNEYDKRGFRSSAKIDVYLIDNSWRYNLEFSCALDFSTVNFTEYVFTINAFDNSIESKIKANKSTKYELVIGEDVIKQGQQYLFDRLKIIETATYHITEGTSNEDGSLSGEYDPANNGRIYVGLGSSEVAVVGGPHFLDDQEYGDGYLIRAVEDVDITLDYDITVSREEACSPLVLMLNDTTARVLTQALTPMRPAFYGTPVGADAGYSWDSVEALMAYINSDFRDHDWNYSEPYWTDKWVVIRGLVWETRIDQGLGTLVWENTGKTKYAYCGVVFSGSHTVNMKKGDRLWLKYDSTTAEKFKIVSSTLTFSWQIRGSAVTIDAILPQELITSIIYKMGVNFDVIISDYDKRINQVLILAAESIRAIPGAKITTSFADFCSWMEAVFGYVYVIDEDMGVMEFKHRREIFADTANVIDVKNAVDISYKVDNSVIYSNIAVGYGKKDYDSVNGRDEFNFTNNYTTGIDLTDKKLSLISPYRADSYGIEFLVEKRDEDTTDNSSDSDVFFVTGIDSDGYYQTNRTPIIQNSITGTLINGEFSPIRCVHANADYISMMANELQLDFASSDGNTDIIIDGLKMSNSLTLEDCEMLSASQVSFTTDEISIPDDINSIIRIQGRKYIYEGYISQASFSLAKPESVKYTLLLKHKYPCS